MYCISEGGNSCRFLSISLFYFINLTIINFILKLFAAISLLVIFLIFFAYLITYPQLLVIIFYLIPIITMNFYYSLILMPFAIPLTFSIKYTVNLIHLDHSNFIVIVIIF